MSSEHLGPHLPSRGWAAADTVGLPRGGRGTRQAIRYSLKGVVSRRFNPIMMALAGRRRLPIFAVVRHQGRRSGRAYATPVGARPTADGFMVPLTFGEGADWFRNVRAAGGGLIRWNGTDYPVIEPEVVDWATARPAFSLVERALIPLIGIEQFARLRRAAEVQ